MDPAAVVTKVLRRCSAHLVDGFPAIMVAVWMAAFAATGTSLPISREVWWQWAAAAVVVANLVVAVVPYRPDVRFMGGVVTLMWLAVWTGYLASSWVRGDSELASRLSMWGVVQFVVLSVFIAWSYGRAPTGQVKQVIANRGPHE